MNAHLLIGFTGAPGVGKDTCALLLQQGHGFRVNAFAEALRDEVAQAWHVDKRMLTDPATKELAIPAFAVGNCNDPSFIARMHELGESLHEARSARWALQRWATEYRRAMQPDYWVGAVERWIGNRRGLGMHRLALTDVRFPNEESMLRRHGGFIVRVHRPELAPRMARDTSAHISEQLQKGIAADADVVNDGDIDALHLELVRVLRTLGLHDFPEAEPEAA